MARYTYNESLVTQSIEQLYSACDALDNTNVDIEKGINALYNARGFENINVDFTAIKGYQSQVVEYIEMMATEITNKAQEIEEYESAPWYKKLFATIGMGALKLVEGLGSFVGSIGDGLVSIAGFVGGIFSSEFQDSVAEFVKKDVVGDAFAEAYETGWLSDVNKYSIMSHESTAANILKGVGVVAGHVIVGVATAGTGTAVSLGVTAGTAAVSGIGSGTQQGLQSGMTFNQAFGEGVKQGAVAAGTTLVVGGIASKLGGATSTALTTTATQAGKATGIEALKQVGTRVLSAAGTFVTQHPVISTGIAAIATGGLISQKAENAEVAAEYRFENSGQVTAEEQFNQQVLYGPPPEPEVVIENSTEDPEIAVGYAEVPQVLYGPAPVSETVVVSPEPHQALYGPPTVTVPVEETVVVSPEPAQPLYGPPTVTIPVEESEIVTGPGQVLYGPPPTQEPTTGSHTGTESPTVLPDGPTTETTTSSSSINIGAETAGSLSNMLGVKNNIPTSSTPITTTETTTSSKVVPMTAGLGAAALAGLGTKVYLDKKSNATSEDEEDIKTEQWNEDPESMDIDYGNTPQQEEEADYLSPTDEYAFQE